MGVAVVVSIDLTIQSARKGFRISAETVAGRATHHVVGGAQGLPEELFRTLKVDAGVAEAAPIVEGVASSPALPGLSLRVVGVDPFSEGPFRPFVAGAAEGVPAGAAEGTPEGGSSAFDVSSLMTTHLGVVLAAGTAADAGVGLGDDLPLQTGGRSVEARVVGLLAPEGPDASAGLRDMLIFDIASAQELLGQFGRLDRIDLRLPEGPEGEAVLGRISAFLPPDARVEPTGTRAQVLSDMIAAFDMNLTALSLLALVFGMFLIYNAQTFSVVQRRELLGSLRALGVTRKEVLVGVVRESIWIGIAGSALGVGLGVLLGRGLVRMVTRTINDLYFVLSVDALSVPPEALIKGLVLGLGATVLASLPPALEASSSPPRVAQTRSFVEGQARRGAPKAALIGVGLSVLGGLLLALPTRSVVASFGGLFLIVLGMALMTPLGTIVLIGWFRPLVARLGGVLGTMAARGVVTSLSRTAPAIASLVVAVSVTVGLGIMIQSFRGTLVRWLETTLQADVYVSVPSSQAARMGGELPEGVVVAFTSHPDVVGANTYRSAEVPLAEGGTVRLMALELARQGEKAFDFAEGGAPQAFEIFRGDRGVLVSEPYAYRHEVGVGDVLTLATPLGHQEFIIGGVFFDYGSEAGIVMMNRPTYDQYFDDSSVNSLGLFVAESVDAAALARELESFVPEGVTVSIRTNQALRRGSLEIFDRTFQVTSVLRLLAFVVAFVGILSALMALEMERSRELGVLRATGMVPGQVWQLVTTQTGLMGLVSGIMAIPVGLVLAVVMIFVVNKRSFGWTLQMEVGPGVLVQAISLAVLGAVIAGLYPAWRMSRTSPAEALRGQG